MLEFKCVIPVDGRPNVMYCEHGHFAFECFGARAPRRSDEAVNRMLTVAILACIPPIDLTWKVQDLSQLRIDLMKEEWVLP